MRPFRNMQLSYQYLYCNTRTVMPIRFVPNVVFYLLNLILDISWIVSLLLHIELILLYTQCVIDKPSMTEVKYLLICICVYGIPMPRSLLDIRNIARARFNIFIIYKSFINTIEHSYYQSSWSSLLRRCCRHDVFAVLAITVDHGCRPDSCSSDVHLGLIDSRHHAGSLTPTFGRQFDCKGHDHEGFGTSFSVWTGEVATLGGDFRLHCHRCLILGRHWGGTRSVRERRPERWWIRLGPQWKLARLDLPGQAECRSPCRRILLLNSSHRNLLAPSPLLSVPLSMDYIQRWYLESIVIVGRTRVYMRSDQANKEQGFILVRALKMSYNSTQVYMYYGWEYHIEYKWGIEQLDEFAY